MSNFDDIDFDAPRKSDLPEIETWDVLSILVLLITACIGGYYLLVFLSPNSGINPLSPIRAGERFPPTATNTPLQPDATWTPSATPYIPPTNTPLPSATPFSTNTPPLLAPPTKTPKPSATPKAPYSVNVDYVPSTKYHPELACNWQGVAGIVLDKNGAHIFGLQVLLVGTWNGQSISLFQITGQSPQLYGTSGFEFQIGTTPANSKGTLYLQLRDQGGGVQLSDNVYINTYTDCNRNMVFVRFKKNP